MLSLQTILPDTLELLKRLMSIPEFNNLRLVGGTALALQYGIRLASPPDIAAMKINAIEGRGSRKDFVDMYFLLEHYSLSDIISFYKQKYPEHSEYRAMMSLSYFEDAELQPMPKMFKDVSWPEIKRRIFKEVEDYNRLQTS